MQSTVKVKRIAAFLLAALFAIAFFSSAAILAVYGEHPLHCTFDHCPDCALIHTIRALMGFFLAAFCLSGLSLAVEKARKLYATHIILSFMTPVSAYVRMNN